ncbi:MAG: hypothetical protein ABSG86_31880 [Thermoguttaceae bacterium]
MRCGRSLFFFLSRFAGCLFALAPALQGATRTAATVSQADVQAAVNVAADGDTVMLPAGTAAWTACVKVAGKCITVEGAGIDKTTIIGGVFPAKSTFHVFEISAKKGGLTRLSNLTIDGGTGPRDSDNKGMLTVQGDSTTWRIDHLRIRATRTCAMHVYASGGVVDHNTFELVGWIFGIYGFNGGLPYGDAAWADATDLGRGDNAFFIEDNVFAAVGATPSYALDGWLGQRVVVRHNRFKNTYLGNHGTESSGRLRGARSFEIYENTMTLTVDPVGSAAMNFRSGTGVIFNNTLTGRFNVGMQVDNYRDWAFFRMWGIATGESPFDKNDVDREGKPIVYDSGTHTGAGKDARELVCAGRKWLTNQWRGYSVHNLKTHKSSIIVANTGDTITARFDGTYGGPNILWNTGDGFKIERCLVALDQTGRGKGNLISGDTPQPAVWPNQEPDPAYVWNNTLNGKSAIMNSSSPHVREGVDFFNGVAKPDYTPYTYPHPLATR